MSREIKFRAWFPKEHYDKPHMAYLDINDEFGGNSATWQLRNITYPEPESPIYMQYTGLKDKNGTDVYEGDLFTMPPHDDKSERYEVKWGHSGFGLPDSQYMEVVGNIWES